MERKSTNSNKKSSTNAASAIRAKAKSGKARRKRLSELEKRVRQIARWHKRLAPQFPDIDSHDLELIIAELLKTPEERMQVMFIKQGEMGFISIDETILAELAEALSQAKLDVIVFDKTAAVATGASPPKKKIELLVRTSARLQMKLKKFAQAFNVALMRPYKPFSRGIRTMGRSINVDFVLAHLSKKSFESIKSHAKQIRVGRHQLWVATLDEIIAAKEVVGSPKDTAALQILNETLRVKNAMKKKNKH